MTKEFVLNPSQLAVSFEQLPTINTPRDITILSASVDFVEAQINGRRHILPNKTSLRTRNKFLPETEDIYCQIGQAFLMMSLDEWDTVVYYTVDDCKSPNLIFNPNQVFTVDDYEWSNALAHLSDCTLKCNFSLAAIYTKKAKSAGISLIVV
jgi:hypothetical protein